VRVRLGVAIPRKRSSAERREALIPGLDGFGERVELGQTRVSGIYR